MVSAPHSLGLIRFDERPATAWKNGQGSTREITRRLLGVRGPHFVWRLSVADIAKDADFSTFPGVQRWATLLTTSPGDGVVLDVAGVDTELVPLEPFAFDGSAETHARLTGGPVSILNVMTVQSRMSAQVRIVDLSSGRPLSIAGATALVQLSGRSVAHAAGGASAELGPLDALAPRPRVRILAGSGVVAVVRMENFRAWRAFSW